MNKKALKTGIKKYDMFGHVITMNFNEQGNSHQTVLGGVMSILIKTALGIYVYLNLIKLIYNKSDETSTMGGLIDPDNIEPVLYNTTNLRIFYPIRKQLENGAQLLMDDELSTYIEIFFKQSLDDWYKPNDQGRFTHKFYGVRYCTVEDFGHGDKAKAMHAAWGGITVLCPDIDDLGMLKLHGDTGSMVANHL